MITFSRMIAACTFLVSLTSAPITLLAAECSDHLLTPDTSIQTTDNRFQSYMRDVICTLDYKQFRETYGAQTGGNYLEIFSGKGDFSADRYQQTQSRMCSDRTAAEAKSSLSYYATSVISPEARNAYVKCILDIPLSCELQPNADAPSINVYQRYLGKSPTYITFARASNGAINNPTIRVGSTLPNGTTNIPFTVANKSLGFGFSMTVLQDGVAEPCTVYLPPTPPPPSYQGIEVVIYGDQQRTQEVFNNSDKKLYRFSNDGPGMVDIFSNNANCAVRLEPKNTMKLVINQGGLHLAADTYAQVFYSEISPNDPAAASAQYPDAAHCANPALFLPTSP